MSAVELAAHCYWAACATLRRTQLAPADQAVALDTLHQLANHGTTRVRDIAAKRLRPVMVQVDDDGDAA